MTIRTRSKATYALVGTRYTTDGRLWDAWLIGYAYSKDARVTARARRLGALILPIVDGKVTLP